MQRHLHQYSKWRKSWLSKFTSTAVVLPLDGVSK
jgi:hypothetical protein